jgi:Chain length determinant protein
LDTEKGQWQPTLYAALSIIWSRRGIVFSTMIAFLLLGVMYLQITPRKYAVSMQVAPVMNDSNSALKGGAQALQSLTGMDLSNLAGGGQGSEFKLYTDGLTSWVAAQDLARDQKLLRALFPKEWSTQTHSWRQPFSLSHAVVGVVFPLLGIPVRAWQPPNGERMYRYLQDTVTVNPDSKDGTVTVLVEMEDPRQAADFLIRLNQTVDNILRKRTLNRSTQYIAYLQGELNKVTVSDYREALIAVLARQEETRMMASADVSYSAEIFSGPTQPTRPTAPNAGLILAMALIAGLFAGCGLALTAARNSWRFRGLPRGRRAFSQAAPHSASSASR